MPTLRDLAEADAYERRRLLRGFVLGDPASIRGLGPSTFRHLIGGAALAIVLLLGVAAAAALHLS